MAKWKPSRDPAKEGEDPERAPPAPARCCSRWVILLAIPLVENEENLVPGADLSLQFEDPPRVTMLTVTPRIHADFGDSNSSYYVSDVLPSGRFLLYTTHGGFYKGVYYICDAHTRVPTSSEHPIFPWRSVGFIEDPRRRGHYKVAQLQPTSTTQHKTLVYYSTSSGKWDVKELASCPQHQLWGCHGGVLAYDGKLWWADLPYGFLTCDPFADEVHLRYVALPEGCVMVGVDTIRSREKLDKYRFAKVSEGKLRYVQIHGLPDEPVVSLWTLVDPEGPGEWQLEYEVRLEEIWGDDSYKEAGLTPGEVPAIALIDPNNHGVLYFLQGGFLFAVDMRASTGRILHCEMFLLGNGLEAGVKYHTSRFVHAWKLPPTLLRLEPSSEPSHKQVLAAKGVREKATFAGTSDLCEKCIANMSLCTNCVARIREALLIGESKLNRLVSKKMTIFSEEDEDEMLTFCLKCCEFGRCHQRHGEPMVLRSLDSQWYVRVQGLEFWAGLFNGVQRHHGNLVLLCAPPGRRCRACRDNVDDELYCSFGCNITADIGASIRFPWAKVLLNENFETRCRIDGFCAVFPAMVPALLQGPPHVSAARLNGAVKSRAGKVLVCHSTDNNRCAGICPSCDTTMSETEEIMQHLCNVLKPVVFKPDVFRSRTDRDYQKDSFCLECAEAFSSMLCDHHGNHRVVNISRCGRRFGVVLPADTGRWEQAFGSIKTVKGLTLVVRGKVLTNQVAVPLHPVGRPRCRSCGLALLGDSSIVCSLKCSSHNYIR